MDNSKLCAFSVRRGSATKVLSVLQLVLDLSIKKAGRRRLIDRQKVQVGLKVLRRKRRHGKKEGSFFRHALEESGRFNHVRPLGR